MLNLSKAELEELDFEVKSEKLSEKAKKIESDLEEIWEELVPDQARIYEKIEPATKEMIETLILDVATAFQKFSNAVLDKEMKFDSYYCHEMEWEKIVKANKKQFTRVN